MRFLDEVKPGHDSLHGIKNPARIPRPMPSALDLPICGSRYRNLVLLSRSNEDGHKLSDREFLDPDHNRAHPFDIPSACESKVWKRV
jgi:hypothetical protein